MDTWRVVESLGDLELVAKLADQAVTMAKVTGSVGATYSESDTEGNIVGFAKVERTR